MIDRFLAHSGAKTPLICGAMYPCSNPELIGAVSAAGGLAIIQPISMTYVHGHDLRQGVRALVAAGGCPVGFNALIEKNVKAYEQRMRAWVDIALEEGVRFFVTAMGNPRWVVDAVHAVGGVVYHDVTERRWALKALDGGVDGLICVNRRAGGHAGNHSAQALLDELGDLGVPLVCAGGVGDEFGFVEALQMGYGAVQMGTRFIATEECHAHRDYKMAILHASAADIVLTERISGVPVSVINTPYIQSIGTRAGWLAKRLLRHRRAKHWMRTYYALKSLFQLKRANLRGRSYKDYFQAGKSVTAIAQVKPAGTVVAHCAAAASQANLLAP